MAAKRNEGRFSVFWGRFKKNKGGVVGLVIILLLILMALLAPYLAPLHYTEQSLFQSLTPPGEGYPLGSDEYGRDILSRIIYGSRVSLQVGIIATMISMVIGVLLGLLAGYYGGLLDSILLALIDISWAFPTILLALVFVAIFSPSLGNVMIAVGLVYWAGYARLVRGEVLSLKEREFVEAIRALGARDGKILLSHILPNSFAPIIVMGTLGMARAILIEASLSFLGLGAQPPIPSWGAMLSDGRMYLLTAPWVTIFPGLAIMVTVLGFNLLGDGLRDALDPRLKE